MKRLGLFSSAFVAVVFLAVAISAAPFSSHLRAPAPPHPLKTTAASSFQINLSWQDRSHTEDQFKIERSTDGKLFIQIATAPANRRTYQDRGLIPETTYFYRVRSHNSAGNSAYSNVAHARTRGPECPVSVVDWGNSVPNAPTQLVSVVTIAAGSFHNLVVKEDGSVLAWGADDFGQATPPKNLRHIVAIAAGYNHSLALQQDGRVIGWGNDNAGEATPPKHLDDVEAIAAGLQYSLALRKNGQVIGWGDNTSGQASPPAKLSKVVAIAAGGFHSLALKNDHTVVGWGYDGSGQATPPPDLKDAIAIAAGDYHSLALKRDGTVVGWGDNGNGQALPPADLRGVIAIAAGSSHSLALRSDGTVVGWGYDGLGQATVGTNLTGVVAISARGDHNLALSLTPAVPLSLTARLVATNQIQLSWLDNSFDEDSFKIERALDDGTNNPGPWAGLATVGAGVTNYVDGAVTANAKYWYRVRAHNRCGDSLSSAPIMISVTPPPAPFTPFAVIGLTNSVNLSWLEMSGAYGIVDGFKIERALDAGGSPGAWMEIARTSAPDPFSGSYSDVGVSANMTYWYRARAFNVLGDSDVSSPININLTPPFAPNYMNASPFADRVNLSWSHDNVYNQGVDLFRIERAPDDGGSPGSWVEIATLAVTNIYQGYFSYSDGARAVNTTYWYRVRAHNWIGNGFYNSPASVIVLPPAAPYGLNASIGPSNSISLAWNEYQGDQNGFRIERASDAGGNPGTWTQIATINLSNSTSGYFSDTNVTSKGTNVTFWYRVLAFNIFGDSPYSDAANIAVQPPPAPIYLSVTPFRNQINLSWSEYYSGVVDGYQIERAPDASGSPGTWRQIASVAGGFGFYTDTNRTAGATYWYRVRAFNWVGTGPYSDAGSATIIPPAQPQYLSASIGTTNRVELFWYDNSADEDGFTIERAPDAGGAPGVWVAITNLFLTNAPSAYYNDTNVTAYTTNWYRVRAFSQLGLSAYTDPDRIEVVPPEAPLGLSANPFRDQINLAWSEYSFGVIGFRIERAPDVDGEAGAWVPIANLHPMSSPNTSYADTNRAAGSTSWYRVRAYNWIGESANSDPADATIAPPARPFYLYGSVGSTNTVNLSWSDYAGDEDGFDVERALDVGGAPGTWAPMVTVSAANAVDTNATANTTNWYRVRAFNLVGTSDFSDPISVLIVPPPAPNYLSAQPLGPKVILNWYVYNYNGQISGYRIERAPDAGGQPGAWTRIAALTNNISTYTDTPGSTPNLKWWYHVLAFNWVGESPFSQPSSVTIVPPAAPDSLSASIGTTNHLNLSWYDYAHDEDGYKLERAPDAGGHAGVWLDIATIFATNSYSSYFTDTNVLADTTNWYRVRAFNILGVSAYSEQARVAVVPPTAPSGLNASTFRDKVNLSWYNSDYYSAAVSGYKLERAEDAGGSPGTWIRIASQISSYYTDTNRAAGATYWYRVSAFNWVGDSPFSSAVSIMIVPPSTPNPPSPSLSAILTNSVDLNCYTYGQDEDGFKIERASDFAGLPGAWTEIATVLATNTAYLSFTDTNVVANTTNWYRVRTFNVIGLSAYSDSASIAVVPPSPPYGLSANTVADRVNLYWYESDGYTFGVTGFKVERALDTNGSPGTWVQIATASGYANYTDTRRTAGATYWYRVRAVNWVGDSPYSDPASATITPPVAPSSLFASLGTTNEVALSWYDSLADQDGFKVERAPDAGGIPGPWSEIATVLSSNTSYASSIDTNVMAYTTNWYRVRSFNIVGLSPYSDPVNVAVTPPGPPQNLVARISSASEVDLNWYGDSSTRVDGYKLQRAPDTNGLPGRWSQLADTAQYTTYYGDTKVKTNGLYWYRVQAYNWVGGSSFSDLAMVSLKPPAAPSGLVATLAGPQRVSLTWVSNTFEVDGFKIERALDAGGSPGTWTQIDTLGSYATNYTDWSVEKDRTYWYRLRAYNAVGNSVYSALVSVTTTLTIPVDPTQSLRTVDARWFGVNAAIWDSNFDTTQTLSLLQEMGCLTLRYPGGSRSDDYHWYSNRSVSDNLTWATSPAKFAHVATKVRAQVFITVNYGTGTPDEAAGWVRSSNVTNNYGYTYWEVGNECYGTWELDRNTNAPYLPHDPWTYAMRFKDYYTAMKAADPTIKVGAVAVPGEDNYINNYTHSAFNPRSGVTHYGWTPVMLSTLQGLGITPDFVVHHFYPEYQSDNDASLLQASSNWAFDAADLRQQLQDYLAANATNVELVCTENNADAGALGRQSTSLVDGLYLADSLGQLMKTEFNGFVWWDLRNGTDRSGDFNSSLYGWRSYGDSGMVNGAARHPTFYAMKLMQYFARPGDTVLQVNNLNPLLSAYASRSASGDISILVINKDRSNTITEPLIIGGLSSNSFTVLSYGIPQDEAVRTNGPATAADIAVNIVTLGTNALYAFPPYSLTLLTTKSYAAALAASPSVTTAESNASEGIDLVGDTSIQITSITRTNNDVLITWQATAGSTNIVEAASSLGGVYRSVSPEIRILGSGIAGTNYLDIGVISQTPQRFYRVRRQ